MFSIFNAQTITFSFYQFNRIPGVHKSAIFYHPAPMMLAVAESRSVVEEEH